MSQLERYFRVPTKPDISVIPRTTMILMCAADFAPIDALVSGNYNSTTAREDGSARSPRYDFSAG